MNRRISYPSQNIQNGTPTPRALFGYTREDVNFALSMSLDEFVDDYLLKDLPAPASPGEWVDDYPDRKDGKTNRRNFYSMGYCWFELMHT